MVIAATRPPMWRRQERYVQTARADRRLLQLFLAPLLAGVFTLWAAWLALAAEAEAELPRLLAARTRDVAARCRWRGSLHVAHLALLVLAGADGRRARWLVGLSAARRRSRGSSSAVGLVWVVGDLLPRLARRVAPELAGRCAPGAARVARPRSGRSSAWWLGRPGRVRARRRRRGRRAGAGRARRCSVGVFSLADTTVAEVMTPRIDIVAVDCRMPREEVVATLRQLRARAPAWSSTAIPTPWPA